MHCKLVGGRTPVVHGPRLIMQECMQSTWCFRLGRFDEQFTRPQLLALAEYSGDFAVAFDESCTALPLRFTLPCAFFDRLGLEQSAVLRVSMIFPSRDTTTKTSNSAHGLEASSLYIRAVPSLTERIRVARASKAWCSWQTCPKNKTTIGRPNRPCTWRQRRRTALPRTLNPSMITSRPPVFSMFTKASIHRGRES